MRILFRILVLILMSQLLGFFFMLIFNDATELFGRDAGDLTMDMIGRMGVDMYILSMQVHTVLLPSLLFLFIFYRSNLKNQIGTHLPKYNTFFPLAVLMLVFSYPLVQFSAVINQKIALAELFSYENSIAGDITRMIIEINSPSELILRIAVIALIPAIGEELFYRAGLQNELRRGFKNPHIAIIVVSVIFSAFHLQFDGFLPRFLLGLMLGYMYFWSSSIWVPVLIHFLNNSMLLLVAYFNAALMRSAEMEQLPSIPVFLLVISIVGTFLIAKSMISMRKTDLKKNHF